MKIDSLFSLNWFLNNNIIIRQKRIGILFLQKSRGSSFRRYRFAVANAVVLKRMYMSQ